METRRYSIISRVYKLVPFFILAAAQAADPPPIKELLLPTVYERVLQREIMTHASLDTVSGAKKHYLLYGAMLAHASLQQTRAALTRYSDYSKLIPSVDRSVYDPKKNLLELEGSIFKFKMASTLHLEERGPRWIHLKIIQGTFEGMEGDVYFEKLDDKGTLVYIRSESEGTHWPPAFVVERGAEIVFGIAGQKIRNEIESEKLNSTSVPSNPTAPTPKSSLQRNNW